MSFRTQRELLRRAGKRYHETGDAYKAVMLAEFVARRGKARTYAIRLLGRHEVPVVTTITRPRAPYYAAQLVSFLHDLVASLEGHGHLSLSDAVRIKVLGASPITVDHLLRTLRNLDQGRGLCATRWALCSSTRSRSAPLPRETTCGWALLGAAPL